MAKEWFSHDYGTRSKIKMAVLLHESGTKGYGLFWVIVEMLYEQRKKWLTIDDSTFIVISKESGEGVEYVKDFVDKCIKKWKVFVVKKNNFSTPRVVEDEKFRNGLSKVRSEVGRKGGLSKNSDLAIAKQKNPVAKQNQAHNITEQNITGDIDNTAFPIERCLEIALSDQRWVKANKTNTRELYEFNRMLESQGEYQRNPADYKRYFSNWKRKGKIENNISGVKPMVI